MATKSGTSVAAAGSSRLGISRVGSPVRRQKTKPTCNVASFWYVET